MSTVRGSLEYDIDYPGDSNLLEITPGKLDNTSREQLQDFDALFSSSAGVASNAVGGYFEAKEIADSLGSGNDAPDWKENVPSILQPIETRPYNSSGCADVLENITSTGILSRSYSPTGLNSRAVPCL